MTSSVIGVKFSRQSGSMIISAIAHSALLQHRRAVKTAGRIIGKINGESTSSFHPDKNDFSPLITALVT